MCRIENNYKPLRAEQYQKFTEHINESVTLKYVDKQNISRIAEGVIKDIEVLNYAEYLILDNLSVRLDRIISLSKN